MRIAHNLAALTTYNGMLRNNKNTGTSLEKLSSGVRINRAADDAAGLSISEKMKSQIRGLSQAQRNIQDGISLAQTADAALGEILDPNLQRLRELAIQASNDSLTSEDRKIIQSEVDQVIQGIDSIANDTEYNTIKLLRPPSVQVPPSTPTGTADIVFIIDRTASMDSIIGNVKSNLDSFVSTLQTNSVGVRLGLVTYGDVLPSEGNDPIIKTDFTSDLTAFKASISAISVSGGGDLAESGLEGITDSSNGALTFSLGAGAAKHFILVADAPLHDDSDGDGGDGKSSLDIDAVASQLASQGIKLNVIGPVGDSTCAQLERLSNATNGDYLDITGNFSSQLNTLATTIIDDSGATNNLEEMLKLNIQVGANENNIFKIELFDARSKKLGISDITVDPREKAEEAIVKIDNAVRKVSAARSKFGAYQNALEHILNNVGNYEINITASQSRIADSDMAKEMSEFVKNNILSQSSQAMMAQANQTPQSVLQLLR